MKVSRIALIIGIAVAACAQPKPAPPSPDEARTAIDAWWTQYVTAVKAADATSLAAMHSDSVYLAEPGMPTMRGRAAVAAAFTEGFKVVRYSAVNIEPDITEWHGTQVVQVGTYNDRFEMQGKPQASYGRYSAVFERDTAGVWRVLRAVVAMDSAVAVKSTK